MQLTLLCETITYCLLEPLAASIHPSSDHWILRDYAAFLLALTARLFGLITVILFGCYNLSTWEARNQDFSLLSADRWWSTTRRAVQDALSNTVSLLGCQAASNPQMQTIATDDPMACCMSVCLSYACAVQKWLNESTSCRDLGTQETFY